MYKESTRVGGGGGGFTGKPGSPPPSYVRALKGHTPFSLLGFSLVRYSVIDTMQIYSVSRARLTTSWEICKWPRKMSVLSGVRMLGETELSVIRVSVERDSTVYGPSVRTVKFTVRTVVICSQTAVVESWPVTSVEVSLYFTIELTYRFLDIFRIHLQQWQMHGYTVWAGPCKNRPPKRGLSHLLSWLQRSVLRVTFVSFPMYSIVK